MNKYNNDRNDQEGRPYRGNSNMRPRTNTDNRRYDNNYMRGNSSDTNTSDRVTGSYSNNNNNNYIRGAATGNSSEIDKVTGNNTGTNIYVKQQLISYIYSTVELFNFKYKLMEYDNDLPLLLKAKHFVSANYSGSNCLLVFIKVKEKYLSYLIDRKTLSYDKNHINYDNLKMFSVNIRLDESIYKGTIFDGIFIQNNRTRTYVITDAYQFRGQNTFNDKIQYKIMNIVAYLNANLKEDVMMNNLKLTVNKLYDIEETETLISKTIPEAKNVLIKGITFYPEISGTRLIFMFNNEVVKQENNININQNNNSYHDNVDNLRSRTSVRYIAKSNIVHVIATFELKKTPDTDVYKLFLVESVNRDGRMIKQSKKMGIAYIPSTECSVMCRNIFAKNVDTRVLMKCKFISDKNKWVPIEQDTVSKYPSDILDVEQKMDIIEDDED